MVDAKVPGTLFTSTSMRFRLEVQHYVELIRNGQADEALAYAQTGGRSRAWRAEACSNRRGGESGGDDAHSLLASLPCRATLFPPLLCPVPLP